MPPSPPFVTATDTQPSPILLTLSSATRCLIAVALYGMSAYCNPHSAGSRVMSHTLLVCLFVCFVFLLYILLLIFYKFLEPISRFAFKQTAVPVITTFPIVLIRPPRNHVYTLGNQQNTSIKPTSSSGTTSPQPITELTVGYSMSSQEPATGPSSPPDRPPTPHCSENYVNSNLVNSHGNFPFPAGPDRPRHPPPNHTVSSAFPLG